MKLKKIIASLTAAAMAVTTMAFAPLSVSAQTLTGDNLSYDLIVKVGSGWTEYYAGSKSMSSNGSANRTVEWSDFANSDGDALDTTSTSNPTMQYIARLYYDDVDESIGLNQFIVPITYSSKKADTEIVNATSVVTFSKAFNTTYQGELYLSANDNEFTHWDSSANSGNGANVDGLSIKDFSSKYSTLSADISVNIAEAIPVTKDNALVENPVMTKGYVYSMELNKYVADTSKIASMMVLFSQNKDSYSYMNGRITNISEDVDFERFDVQNNEYVSKTVSITNDSTGGTVKIIVDFLQDSYATEPEKFDNKICYVEFFDASGKKLAHVDSTFTELKPCTAILLNEEELTLDIGEKTTLTATTTPADTTDIIEWTTSNDKVVSVDETGKIEALSEGTATITAKVSDTVFAECTVTVKKAAQPITVKSNNDTYGTASADVKEAAEGTKVTLTAVPKTGYKFVEWKSDDVTITDSTFTMPANAVEITAVFEEKAPDEFDITVAKTTNGTVTVKGGKTASVKDETIDLVITPDKGYEVDTVKVNGEAITGTSFTMPEKDVTIEVTFKKSTYTVTVAAAANGTVTADKATAQMGDTVTVTATPDKDYELSKITVNGTAITGNTFTMPAENVTVAAEFKKIGSAGAEIVVPEGVNVSFAGSKEDILKAVFGDDYADLVAAGYKLDVVMTVKDETAVSAEDKALVEGALSSDMHIGLLIDVSLVMTKDGVSTVVANSSKPVSFVIGVPDSIIADGRTYSVIRVHNGAAEDIGGTYDAANKTITVSSDKYSTYAVVYKDAPAPQPQPTVTYYPITADRNVTASASSAAAGEQINVRVDFGYDAYVYCGGRVISKITENGSFTMPAGKVTIVSQANGYLVMIKNAAPNSYIFVYDADMNYIKTNGSVKGIKGEGKITVKLGEEYAGKTVTLYKGRKSTNVELDSKTLDENGNATFTVEGGKNYTAVVE